MNKDTRRNIILVIVLVFAILGALSLIGCEQEQQIDVKPEIVHENTIELYVNTSTLPDGRILTSTSRFIYQNWRKRDSIVIVDTLPSLGTEKVHMDSDDNDGEGKDTTVAKQYDIYFQMR